MDRIEPRVHDEFTDYKEKFYNFTLRQWLFAILILIIVVPLYIFLSPVLGSDLTGWLVIILACPLAFFGFIPVQGLNAEKIIFFWKRNYINFAKPIFYKTKEEVANEEKKGKVRVRLTKQEKLTIKKKNKEEKKYQKKLKLERQRQRELAKAKRKFGLNNQNSNSFSLSEEDTKALLQYVKQSIGKEIHEEDSKENKSQKKKEN